MFDYFIEFYVDMSFGYALIITDVMFSLGCVVVLNRLELRWQTILRRLGETVFVGLCLMLTNSLWYWITGEKMDVYWPFAIAIVLYAVLFSRYKWNTRASVTILFYVCFLSVLTISEGLGYLFRMEWGVSSVDMTTVLQVAIVALISVYLYVFCIDRFSVAWYYTVIMAVICAVHVVCTQVLSSYIADERLYSSILNIGFIVIELIAYYIFYYAAKEYDAKLELQAMYLKSERDRELITAAHENVNKMHTLRHDLKNQYSYMLLLLQNKEYDRLEEYFKKYSGELLEAVSFTASGNHTLDYILNIEQVKAREAGVTLDIKIAVAPVLPFDDDDLCSLVTNLLDNAVEACVACCKKDEGTDPVVTAGFRQQQGCFLVRVVNPVDLSSLSRDRQGNLTLRSEKQEDVKKHGFGVKIIRKIARKYKGDALFKEVDGKFVADVMLSMEGYGAYESPAESAGAGEEEADDRGGKE